MRNLFRPRFSKDRRGNVAILFALSLPVVILAIAFAVDFGRAAQLRTRLSSIADAAALAAVTPTMMSQSNANAIGAATNMFNGQAAAVTGLTSAGAAVTVTINNPNGNVLDRYVTVCYQAAEQTLFAGILGVSSLQLSNCAQANAEAPPNIDFYVLLDNSPSMALPATQAGLDAMQSLTPQQQDGSCAFACHQGSTNNYDTAGNPCQPGNGNTTKAPTLDSNYQPGGDTYCDTSKSLTQIDNYQLARNNNITLRLDELNSGLTTLMQTAQTTTNSSSYGTPPAYRFAVNEMDSSWQIGFNGLMALTSNYVSNWASVSPSFGVMEMWQNNVACANSACTSGNSSVGDVATNFDDALSNANSQMPAPGNGTDQAGDKPQEVLFWVTDGVEDEESGGSRLVQQINAGTSTNYCTTIKNRNIRIAILYTEYLPVPVNTYYQQHVAPIQSDIGPALQACASPGLFYDVSVTGDLSQALQSLFQAVVQSANLSQ